MAACASDPEVKVVTKTETVIERVEVYKPLPDALVRPVPYPSGLGDNFTVDELIDLTFDLFDALDQANADKAKAGELTQPNAASEPTLP